MIFIPLKKKQQQRNNFTIIIFKITKQTASKVKFQVTIKSINSKNML